MKDEQKKTIPLSSFLIRPCFSRSRVNQPLDHIGGLGPSGAAIGVDRHRVGVDADHFGEDVGDVVLAREQRRVEIGRH